MQRFWVWMVCFLYGLAFSLSPIAAPLAVSAAAPSETLSVSATAAVLMNGDTGEILWSKNPEERLPMASTTKIMTALLLAEQPDLSVTLTVTEEMATVEGSSMGLLPGDTVSYHDLLYGMLLASGNDAANTTAIALGGSVEGFAAIMNREAEAIGLTNTHFVTPSGLDDPDHYTTAYDLAKLAMYALQNENFAEACASSSATLCYGNPPYQRTLTNHNKLLSRYDGCIGVKTGFTKKSGRCLVSAAEREDARLIAVTLHAPDDWNDHVTMLDYGFRDFETVTLAPEIPAYLPVEQGMSERVLLQANAETFTFLAGDAASVTQKVELPDRLMAPVTAGETVGTVSYYLGARLLAKNEVVVLAAVDELPPPPSFWEYFLLLLEM